MDEPDAEPTARQIAAFDFDGTLTRRDTVVPFLLRLFGAGRVVRAVSQVAPTAARARLGRLESELHHRDVVKERLLQVLFRGEDPDHIAAIGRSFADTIPARLQTETMARVAWHREQGHALVIVSASLLAYLEPFAADHGFDHVIGVGLEVGDDGRLTGRLTGPNVRGPEKEVRLRAWLGEGPRTMWAYGNSSGDRELLAMADHPTWVTPARRRPGPREQRV